MAVFSKEAAFIDETISTVLDICFFIPECPVEKCEAIEMFRRKVDSPTLYFAKVHLFKQAYDLRVASIINETMMPIAVKLPSSYKLAHLYLGLLRGTIMNPKSVVIAFTNCTAVGNVPPRLYVLCVMLAGLSARRSFNDSILQPLFSGRSSCGKSKLFDSFVSISKLINSEANGVGRFQIAPSQLAFYWSDFNYSMMTSKSELQIVKNILRYVYLSII